MKKIVQKSKSGKRGIAPGTWMYKYTDLRQQLMSQIAQAIDERQWTQAQAADHLGVSQPRISDLLRAKADKFSIDMLVQWLLMLGQDVALVANAALPEATNLQSRRGNIQFLTRAIELAPTNFGLYMERGDLYFDFKQFELAIGDYTRAVELAPDKPGPRNQRALAYHRSGQLRAAMLESNELIKRCPDYSGGYSQRAATYVALDEFDSAIKDYSKSIKLRPDLPGGYWNRACIYERLGKFKKAIADYEQVVQLSPDSSFAQKRLSAVKGLSRKKS